jgi:hypothetical protein
LTLALMSSRECVMNESRFFDNDRKQKGSG